MFLKALQVGPFVSNCYVAGSEKTHDGIIVDPGADAERILATVKELGLKVSIIVATHSHIDHVSAVVPVKKATGAPFALHEADGTGLARSMARMMGGADIPEGFGADRFLKDGDEIKVGDLSFKVLHTPGHSPGGICIYGSGVVFAGDTLFNFSIGRADMPGCSYEALLESIRTKLMTLPPETKVYPGHGNATTIGVEKEWNPFLRDGVFRE